MAGENNGIVKYATMDDVRLISKRLEADATVGDLRFRVQALSSDELSRIQRRAMDRNYPADDPRSRNNILALQLACVYGIIQPHMMEDGDEAAALAVVKGFPTSVIIEIGQKIIDMTQTSPSDIYKSFFTTLESLGSGEGTPSSTLSLSSSSEAGESSTPGTSTASSPKRTSPSGTRT